MSDKPADKPSYPEPRVIRRLSLFAPDPGAENERAQLLWQFNRDNPELVVWTRGPSEKGKPPIRAGLNYENALTLCDMVERVAKNDGKMVGDLPIFTLRATSEGRRERVLQSTIRVAQTSDGLMQIAVFDADETRPRILFPIMISRWNDYVKYNGESVTESEASRAVAINYAAIFRKNVLDCSKPTTNSEHQAMYPRSDVGGAGGGASRSGGGGGGFGGRQNGGSNSGGRQPSTAGYEEFTL